MKDMQLDMEIVHIKNIAFGQETKLQEGTLYVNKEEMLGTIADPFFSKIDIELARPGESVRILPVKDVIEPRIKVSEKGGSFPGFLGKFEECGYGITKVLKGCAIVTTGTIVGFQEGLIDMSGPAAEYCYFSKLNNIVIVADTPEGVNPAKHEEAVRVLGLKAANYLSLKTKEIPADEVKTYELKKPERPLPKVGLIYMIMAQGLIHDNYVYGQDAKKMHPTLLHPNEIMDGAIVNGTCVIAADKNTTYDHQNNPLIEELYKRHGIDLDFRGCIVVPTYTSLHDKERCCASGVRIAQMLNLDGVIIPEEGAGNPEADLMKLIRGCEQCGIKTVGLVTGVGGEEGVTDSTPEADAMITVGSDDLNLKLPPMKRVIGHAEQVKLLSGGGYDCIDEDGNLNVNIIAIMCSLNQMGRTKLSSIVL